MEVEPKIGKSLFSLLAIAIFDGIGNILRSDACGCSNFLADGGRQICFKIESELVEGVRSTKWTTFAHEFLLNLRASKPSQNSTYISTEICGQFWRMNPY